MGSYSFIIINNESLRPGQKTTIENIEGLGFTKSNDEKLIYTLTRVDDLIGPMNPRTTKERITIELKEREGSYKIERIIGEKHVNE